MNMIIGAGCLAVLLGGCGSHYWVRPGASAEAFMRDDHDCARSALEYVETARFGGAFNPYGGGLRGQSFKGQQINEARYRMCLRERGWTRVQTVGTPDSGYRGVTDE